MAKVSSSLYVRRANAADSRDILWSEALRLQTEANQEIDAGLTGRELQLKAHETAEMFLQMDERVQYLTLRVYWASGQAEDDPDAQDPELFALSLFRERDRRDQERRRYWNDTSQSELVNSRDIRARLKTLARESANV